MKLRREYIYEYELHIGDTIHIDLSVSSAFSILHSSWKEFQKYIVDLYVKTENSRLNIIWNNIKDFRIKLFSGLLDALCSFSENINLKRGKFIILPSTLQGRARYM